MIDKYLKVFYGIQGGMRIYVNIYSGKSSFCYAVALLALTIAMTTYSGNVVGTGNAYAQPNSCECVISPGVVGVIGSVRGNVFVSQENGSVPAQPEMLLHAGGSVIVGPQSASTVRFGQRCRLRLGENTVLEARPQEGRLCVAVNEQGAGSVTQSGDYLVPGLILGGLGVGVLAIGTSHDEPVSK